MPTRVQPYPEPVLPSELSRRKMQQSGQTRLFSDWQKQELGKRVVKESEGRTHLGSALETIVRT